MKKILIVNKSFELGGIESSMINMANALSEQYEVHLFLYYPEGKLKERLNSKVKILEPSWRIKSLGMPLKVAVQTKSVKIVAFKLFAGVWTKLFGNELPIEIAIKHQPKLTGYDLAIAYHQEQRKKSVVSGFARVVDRCVTAKQKAAWLHFDSNTIDLDSQYNNPFYQKMDKVVCVSKSLMENFAQSYPELKDKMEYCYNFLLYDLIKEKSLEKQAVEFPEDQFACFSACRLTQEKALLRGIAALAPVLQEHNEVVWYIAGDGPERGNIENAIRECGLEKQIVLIGHQSNPYAYMRNADLVVNVSSHEAAPMVFLESKALGTPVFATRTASAAELLDDKVDSFICENSQEGIREQFAWLMENRQRVKEAKIQLENYHAGNEESMQKIRALLET